MQHLNDDMDELFRKAADDYPLNTRTPDWNKVAQALSEKETPAPPPVKKTYRRYTWLLLLLPLGFVITEMAQPGSLKRLASINKQRVNSEPGNKSGQDIDGQERGEKEVAAKRSIADPAKKELIPVDERAGSDNEEIKKSVNAASGSGQEKTVPGSPGAGAKIKNPDSNEELQSPKNGLSSSKKGRKHPGSLSNLSGALPALSVNADGGSNTLLSNSQSTKNKPGKTVGTEANGSEGIENSSMSPYTKSGLAASGNSADLSLIAMPEMTTLKPGPVKKQKIKNKNFYVGAIGGLDLTTVSFQQTSDVGYHFGGIAGYSFSKKWSVEVGFIVEKKSYYTDGEHFDKSGLHLGPNTTVVSVDGDCKMFEIPFSVKYDIRNTYKSNFFVTGGFSSYIMKKEDYEMVYQYGSGSRATHYYPYENSSKNFFAELRITGGYAIKLPQQFSFRIEPYLNIPVAGVGYGKLHLMSAGLNAGVFKRIF
jgi:hypothetical protein